jgi:hypothetical protein
MALHIVIILMASAAAGTTIPEPKEQILVDVQDRLDSLDQAGLYLLLERLGKSPDFDSYPIETIAPGELLAHPADYRGRVLSYPALVYRRSKQLNVSRKIASNQENLCYIVAKIPYCKDLAYPAVVILPQPPQTPVDQATIQGYFYMILRSKTQKPPGEQGPAVLDYLVFVAHHLLPAKGESKMQPPPVSRSLYWSGSSLAVLAMLWLWLRWKIRSRPARFQRMIEK